MGRLSGSFGICGKSGVFVKESAPMFAPPDPKIVATLQFLKFARRETMYRATSVLTCLLLGTACLAQTKASAKTSETATTLMPKVVPLGTEQWSDIPPSAMVGIPSVEIAGKLQMAVIQGNPMLAGQPYTMRLSCTDGSKIAPHWHPTTENVTVIKGTFAIGTGSKWDPAGLRDLPTGGFVSAPARMRHFATCKGNTVVQVHGLGPFVVNFVQPGKSQSGN